MSAASDYTENNVMAAIFGGVAMPIPAHTYIALHTADSGEVGSSELTTANFPSYARQCAEGISGAMGTGWVIAPAPGSRRNTNTIQFTYTGTPDLTVTHWSVWDAAAGGNMLVAAPLLTSRIIRTGDSIQFIPASLTVSMA